MPKRSGEFLNPMPHLCNHLKYLLDFLRADYPYRKAHPLLSTSPYYRWLAYTLLRRELFDEIKRFVMGYVVVDFRTFLPA